MSSAGQVVGGVVGAVVGFFAGGPSGSLYGAQIGMMAGGYLDPPKGPNVEGPRLSDLTIQTSTYGAVIPRAYGTVTVNGNVIWLENNSLKETVTKKKSGGKGGGSKSTSRTYTYSATFAVGLCKGPIAGVRRIWVGPDMIYDAGSSDPDTIAASNAAVDGFAIYLGDDTQAADPRIEATMGAGNVPAWRGLAYIVFYDLALARYANTLAGAQVRVEIMQLGATYDYPVTAQAMPATRAWIATAWNGSIYCSVAQSTNKCATSADGISWVEHDLPVSATWVDIASNGDVFVLIALSTGVVYVSDDGITWASHALPASGVYTQVVWGGDKFLVVRDTGNWASSANGMSWLAQTAPAAGLGFGTGGYAKSLAWNGSMWACVSQFGTQKIFTSPSGISGSWTDRLNVSGGGWVNATTKSGRFCLTSNAGSGWYISDDGISWTRSTTPAVTINSVASDSRAFVAVSNNDYYISYDGLSWTAYAMPHTGTTWGSVCWNGSVFHIAARNNAWAATIQPFFASSIYPTLGDVVSAECLQSGLIESGDIDVTALTTDVRGYRIGSLGAIRAALEPLQGAWPFDVVQHGYTLRFVVRGGSSVVTIPAEDLDARGAGESPGVQITASREMDSQLPQRVTIKHLDYSREYDTGSQYAERLTTSAINAMVLDLPIVLTATEAAGKAEVLLYLYWLERYDVSIVLPPTYLHLEPGDVVTLVTPEGNVSLRLTAITYTSDGRVECKAKYANAAIYTPTAVAADPVYTGTDTITPVGGSVYVLLDVPMISSAQSGPSFLAAMTGEKSGWAGGNLLQSTDSGSSWASLHDFGAPGASIGACSNTLGSVDHRVIDAGSVLSVTMAQGDLYSITLLAMLAGGNHFAYGADGRWEIIAAQTCTLITGSTYELTNLLRGRFGSEWAMSLHAAGDSLILLDTADVAAITTGSGTIGLSYLYRGITYDRDISTDSDRSFAYHGVNLKPLSPIALAGSRNPSSNDWLLSWIRRTRDGGEWRDNVDASLGEASEAYQIDVFADGTYATVKRTISASSSSASYASADQVIDFGSNQATLYLKIYQISAAVGRGYPLTQSLTG
jgi:hypothetical protein